MIKSYEYFEGESATGTPKKSITKQVTDDITENYVLLSNATVHRASRYSLLKAIGITDSYLLRSFNIQKITALSPLQCRFFSV